MRYKVISAFILLPFFVQAQNLPAKQSLIEKFELQPIVALQFWGSYTMGEEVFDETKGDYISVDDRLNFQLRRSRLGLKGKLAPNLKFNFISAYDLVGRDVLSGTQAGGNNGASPTIRLWNAYVQWQIKDESLAWNLTTGYFSPQLGRESISSPFGSGSMEKAWSQNYLRRHLVGTGPGRSMGMNLGGLFVKEASSKINWGYDIGLFTPTFTSLSGNSSGIKAAPLAVGRLALYLGDLESETYSLGHKVNHQGKRKGLSVGISTAFQGETDLFDTSITTSVDWLFNWNNFNLDGDWSWMNREGQNDLDLETIQSESQTAYLRLSYNISVKKYAIEPSVMLVHFQGAATEQDIEDATFLQAPAGRDQSLELGLNLHLSAKIKLNMHYTAYQGDAGEAENGAILNNYLFQSGVGPIRRGNWLGIGLTASY